MFQKNIEIIVENFSQFKGEGMYFALFFIAILYIWIKEENKNRKIFFVYYNLIVLFITLNPLFNKIVGGIFTSSVYLRVFWLLSIGITIAYAAIKFIDEGKDKLQKIVIIIGIIAIIIFSGKIVYNTENYENIANIYKLPDESIQVAQIIGADDEVYKKALVSETLAAYIRQVDASIGLAYKRDPQGYLYNEFVLAMLQGRSEDIANLAIENNCNYIVLKKDIPLTLDMGYFGFQVFSITDNYTIYKIIDKD